MDLTTEYMGLTLKNPLVASSSPLTEDFENIKRLEEAGVGAVVLFSLFEEQIEQEAAALEFFTNQGEGRSPEALSFFPDVSNYRVGPHHYLELVRRAAESCDIPIIASLNGVSPQGWRTYAAEIAEAGAAAIELNPYFLPSSPLLTGRQVEELHVDVIQAVKSVVDIPVAMKLSPFFSSMAHLASQLDQAGADALVLFNRFYQPDFDIETLEVRSTLELSSPAEVRLPLQWISILRGRLECSLAATTGVHGATEMIKYLMAGADVAMTTSALLEHGIPHARRILADLVAWMERRGYDSVEQMKGSMSFVAVKDPTPFERANYISILKGFRSRWEEH